MLNRYKEKDELLFSEVQKLMDGDMASYTKVYELSERYIYKIIYDIVRDVHTTEDMMQETYLQIYNKIDTLREAKSFYVWAGRIASNLSLRYLQKYRKEVLQVPTEEDDNEEFLFDNLENDDEAFIPETVLENEEQQKIIAGILEELSPEQKLTVQYYYYEEMSVGAIAELMECSQGTVKSRLSYARKTIKTEVEKFEIKNDVKLYSLASLPLFYLFFRAVAEGDITLSTDVAKGSDVAQENDVAKKNDVVKGNDATKKIAGISNKATGSGFLGTLTGKAVLVVSILGISGAAVGVAAIGMHRQPTDVGGNQNSVSESESLTDVQDSESTQDVTDSIDTESTQDVTESQNTEITPGETDSEETESTPGENNSETPETTPGETDTQESETTPGETDTQEPETTPEVTDEQVADVLARNQAYRQYLQDNSIFAFAITDINKDGTQEMLIYPSDTGNPTSIVGWHEGQLMVENGAERPLDGSGVVELYYSDESEYVLTVVGETDGALEDWGEIGEGTITKVGVVEDGVYYGNTHFYSDDTGEWRIYSMTSGEDDLSTNKESIIALIKEKVPNMKKWTQSYEVTDANLDTYLSLDENVIRQELQ